MTGVVGGLRLSLCLTILAPTAALTQTSASHRADSVAVRRAFESTVAAHNAGDVSRMLPLIAADAVISYPGLPDTGVPANPIHDGFRKQLAPRPGMTRAFVARIEEIIVSGDIAIVRALWTVDWTRESPAASGKSVEKDLEIWGRQGDGSWKLVRGMSFPVKQPAQTTGG